MARIKVTYTIEEFKTIEIEDFTLTEEEIDVLAEAAVSKILPGDEDSSEWEWETAPKAKGSQMTPPPDWYVDTPFGKAATNGHCIMFEHCPLMLKTGAHWLDAPGKKMNIEGLLSEDFRSFPPHEGYFDPIFLPFKKLKGLKVLGKKDGLAYLVLGKDLIACLMPMHRSEKHEQFQFNAKVAR